MNTVFSFLGGKKIGWCLMVFLASVAMLVIEKLTSVQWVDLVKFITIVAVGGNVAGMMIHGFSKNPVGSDISTNTPKNP